MKRARYGALIVFSLILSATASATAASAPAKPAPESPATPVQLEAGLNNLVFTGTVKKIPGGTALVTQNATYLLEGGNFNGIVGREVNIIGKVVKDGSIEKIQVARALLAQQ